MVFMIFYEVHMNDNVSLQLLNQEYGSLLTANFVQVKCLRNNVQTFIIKEEMNQIC